MPPKRAKTKQAAAPDVASTVGKRAKTKEAAAPDAAPTVSTLLARCSRGDLERLLEESVRTGEPCTYAKVHASLPEAKQACTIARPTVTSGQAREGTGWFDCVDDELLITIFLQVHSTATRLASAIAVCKAWRGVLKCAELFTEIDLSASRYSRYYSSCVSMTSSNMPRLIKWLPDVSAVTSLRIDTGDKHQAISPDVAKKALPLFTGLTDLEMSGKKTTAALLTVLAKQPFCANLTRFVLGDCGAKPEDALPALVNATRLTSLKLDFGFGGDPGYLLRSVVNGWRSNRGGDATPLLTTFETTGYSGSLLPVSTFVKLADLFPELSTLRTGLSCRSAPLVPLDSIGRLTQFERLRELSLSSLIHRFGGDHLTSEKLNNVLRIIFHVAPNLTKLKVCHGTMYVSGKEQKGGKRVEPHPNPNGALDFLPATLESLHLGEIALGPLDFDATALGSLRHLTLDRCGPRAAMHASALCARCPFLELKCCFTSELTPDVPRFPRLICLDPHVEAKRKEAEAAAKAARSQGHSNAIPIGAPGTSASGSAGSPESSGVNDEGTTYDEGSLEVVEEEVNMANDDGYE